MANIAQQRIKREFTDIMKSSEVANNQIKITPQNENLMTLHGEIAGPPDTPYEGARFELEIIIPDNYPFVPPKVKFLTKIWHPNISSATGVICLDILKDQWAAAMSLRTVLLSVQALLAAAEPDDPQDAVVAGQYRSDRRLFETTARHWAGVYAKGPAKDATLETKVEQMIQMGFTESDSRSALSMKSWEVEQATEFLLK